MSLDGQTIVRILPLSDLIRAIDRGRYKMCGRQPTRVVACPLQVRSWASQCEPPQSMAPVEWTSFSILGVPVVEGAHDAQPELIWAAPIGGGA